MLSSKNQNARKYHSHSPFFEGEVRKNERQATLIRDVPVFCALGSIGGSISQLDNLLYYRVKHHDKIYRAIEMLHLPFFAMITKKGWIPKQGVQPIFYPSKKVLADSNN